ncbi:hypothetical protein PFICI_05355 [Pestalotiopsis fici W106-1]|uniref:TRUD domain-containing protein n=1 Tax=Pestalotiopsis fici (strain W106-1 / CGMCC3.15140) TaxID=1229662 RepID=W3XBS6_PESFW|nr:uncharacterized protein PFICI_05355 [Pestalotiopsis fici W106-1]ETS83479.1 hypothetical protein PFICI_05355 [Pestalotiopsis fici W106-1]
MATHTAMTQGNDPELRGSLERKVGILHFVSPKDQGWTGVLRKRFTDFQVHEISEAGEVVHLKDYFTNARDYERAEARKNGEAASSGQAPGTAKPKENGAATSTESQDGQPTQNSGEDSTTLKDQATESAAKATEGAPEKTDTADGEIAASDLEKLKESLGSDVTEELVALFKKVLADPEARPQTHGLVKFPQIERSVRGPLHAEIRRIFSSKIETETNHDGIIVARAQPPRKSRWGTRADNRNRNNQANQVKIGKFLHFSLYKENKDTMEAINILATALGMRPNFFSTAGTKDRRAVTVQRVSIRGRDPKKVISANAKLRGLAIGDFKFSDKDLYLGCHNGNEFTIVLKDCTFQGAENESLDRRLEIAQSTLDRALADISQHGFINYFGTQRFGTYEIGTQTIGMKILQGDLKGVIHDLLSYDSELATMDPNTLQDDNNRLTDMYRAKALAKYKDGNDADAAAKALPRRCNTEFAILKHLSKQPTDYHGAVLAITRNMRNMYLHAYQSLVWNFAASKRWELFGKNVVKGDLVFALADDTQKAPAKEDLDEENIHLAEAAQSDDGSKPNVRVLTAEDVASGRYSIQDVVLSIPGTDVIYPDNEIGDFYKEFMGREENGGLDPQNMHRVQKAFSLTGDYRKFMGGFIGSPSGSVHSYGHDHDQLVPTDLDLIKARQAAARAEAAVDGQGNSSAGWKSFAQNVGEDERNEAKVKLAAAQRRKAEDMEANQSGSRLNDTWVQTSTDGSNKRVKVDTSTDMIEAQIGSTAQVEASNQHDDVKDLSTLEVSTPNIVNVESTWVARFKKVLLQLYDATIGNLFRFFNTDKTNRKTPQDTQQPGQSAVTKVESECEPSDKPAAEGVPQSAPIDTPMADAPLASHVGKPSRVESAQSPGQQDKTLLPVEDQKIAVVLKFSLGSSAYATMVLRELQG